MRENYIFLKLSLHLFFQHAIFIVDQIATLKSLGFKPEDCIEALEKCKNKLDDAAIWLTHNATPLPTLAKKPNKPLTVHAIEVNRFEQLKDSY